MVYTREDKPNRSSYVLLNNSRIDCTLQGPEARSSFDRMQLQRLHGTCGTLPCNYYPPNTPRIPTPTQYPVVDKSVRPNAPFWMQFGVN